MALLATLAIGLGAATAADDWLHAQQIAPGVYVLRGEGAAPSPHNLGRVGNLGFLVGKTGVIVIDTGSSSARAHELIDAIRSVTPKPIQGVLISHPAQEVLFGDAVFKELGVPIWSQADTPRLMVQRCDHCLETLKQVLGEERMAGTRLELPTAHPFSNKPFTLAGRTVSVLEGPKGTVPGNLVIRDEVTGVVFAGALLSVHRIPAVQDTTPVAWEQALTMLRDKSIFAIVPAYGPVVFSQRAIQRKKTAKSLHHISEGSHPVIQIDDAVDRLQGYLRELETQARDHYARRTPLEEVTQNIVPNGYSDWDDYSPNHAHNLFYRYLQLESEELLSP